MDSEDEHKNRLFLHLKNYISKRIEDDTVSYEGKKVIELRNLGIKNYYGLEMGDCTVMYDSKLDARYPFTFKMTYKFNDFLPIRFGMKTYCFIEGQTLEETLNKFILHIGSKVYCRECGNIRNDSEFSIEEDQCATCIFETLILYDKVQSNFCSICQTNSKKNFALNCGHTFHRRCVSKLLRNACPLCNAVID